MGTPHDGFCFCLTSIDPAANSCLPWSGNYCSQQPEKSRLVATRINSLLEWATAIAVTYTASTYSLNLQKSQGHFSFSLGMRLPSTLSYCWFQHLLNTEVLCSTISLTCVPRQILTIDLTTMWLEQQSAFTVSNHVMKMLVVSVCKHNTGSPTLALRVDNWVHGYNRHSFPPRVPLWTWQNIAVIM